MKREKGDTYMYPYLFFKWLPIQASSSTGFKVILKGISWQNFTQFFWP